MRPFSPLFGTALAVLLAASPALAQPVVDGTVTDADYVTLGTRQTTNGGFHPNLYIQTIRYYADLTNDVLYIGVEGGVNTGSGDGIGLLLGFSELDGPDAGTPIGGISGGGHFMGGAPFVADFEVEYGFAVNGGSFNAVYVDGGRFVGTPAVTYLGTTTQSGTPGTGSLFGTTVTYAFDNAGTAGRGFEMSIPFAALGITGAVASTLQASAFIVSNSGYFSDLVVPGNPTAGNLGFRPNFSTNTRASDSSGPNPGGPIGTGPYHTAELPLGPPLATGFTFTSPTAGQVFRAGGKLKPIWTTTPAGGAGDVTVTLRKGGVDQVTLYSGPNLAQPFFGAARYTLPVTIAGGTDYTVHVSLDSNPAVSAESAAFTIVAADVIVSSPAGGETFSAGEATTVSFTFPGATAPAKARITLREVGQSGGVRLAVENDTDGSVDVTIPSTTASGQYFLIVSVTDADGKVSGKSGVFTVEGVLTRTADAPAHYVVAAEASSRQAYLTVATDGLAGEIGVFAGDVLVGAARVTGATTDVVVFGADLDDDAPLALRHFDGVETALAATAVRDADGASAALVFADMAELTVETAKGTGAAAASLVVAASPNPTTGAATIRVSEPAAVRVYDALGRQVADLGSVEAEARWDASGAAPGVYVVRATGATATTSIRVTVAR